MSKKLQDGAKKNSLHTEFPWEELCLFIIQTKADLLHFVTKWTQSEVVLIALSLPISPSTCSLVSLCFSSLLYFIIWGVVGVGWKVNSTSQAEENPFSLCFCSTGHSSSPHLDVTQLIQV